MKVLLAVIALFALCSLAVGDNRHEMCCHSCHESYHHAHHLKESCMRGCRLYSLIFLAHDKGVKQTEISGLCNKSCNKGFSKMLGGADARKACNRGCAHQETVFREHKPDHHVAKKMVMHGLALLPSMHSPVAFHHRMFEQLRQIHRRMMMAMHHTKAVAVQRVSIRVHSLPPGPDGKPRYHVEIHQYPTSVHTLGHGPIGGKAGEHNSFHGKHGEVEHHHHGHVHRHQYTNVLYVRRHGTMHKIRHFFAHMPHGYKLALRISLCALLMLSLFGLVYLFCSTFRTARPNARLSLAKAFKKKPSVQSGDIFYVDVDKKPLIEEDELEKVRRDEA